MEKRLEAPGNAWPRGFCVRSDISCTSFGRPTSVSPGEMGFTARWDEEFLSPLPLKVGETEVVLTTIRRK